jgi:hypothetical protein
MNRVRSNGEVTLGGGIKAAKVGGGGGKPAPENPLVPTMVDFLADVTRCVKRVLPRDISFARFRVTYMFDVTEDGIDREKYAQLVLRDRRHSAEQRCGAEFIRVGLYPLSKYMKAPRKPRPRKAL